MFTGLENDCRCDKSRSFFVDLEDAEVSNKPPAVMSLTVALWVTYTTATSSDLMQLIHLVFFISCLSFTFLFLSLDLMDRSQSQHSLLNISKLSNKHLKLLICEEEIHRRYQIKNTVYGAKSTSYSERN